MQNPPNYDTAYRPLPAQLPRDQEALSDLLFDGDYYLPLAFHALAPPNSPRSAIGDKVRKVDVSQRGRFR